MAAMPRTRGAPRAGKGGALGEMLSIAQRETDSFIEGVCNRLGAMPFALPGSPLDDFRAWPASRTEGSLGAEGRVSDEEMERMMQEGIELARTLQEKAEDMPDFIKTDIENKRFIPKM